jgi:hypothetical protein
MNRHELVNLRDGDLNLDQMVVMKDDRLMDDQKSQLNLVAMIYLMKGVHSMGDQKMIHLMKGVRLMDDQNYLVDLNFRDALPFAYSLISIII